MLFLFLGNIRPDQVHRKATYFLLPNETHEFPPLLFTRGITQVKFAGIACEIHGGLLIDIKHVQIVNKAYMSVSCLDNIE
jgi:hypothetical protein